MTTFQSQLCNHWQSYSQTILCQRSANEILIVYPQHGTSTVKYPNPINSPVVTILGKIKQNFALTVLIMVSWRILPLWTTNTSIFGCMNGVHQWAHWICRTLFISADVVFLNEPPVDLMILVWYEQVTDNGMHWNIIFYVFNTRPCQVDYYFVQTRAFCSGWSRWWILTTSMVLSHVGIQKFARRAPYDCMPSAKLNKLMFVPHVYYFACLDYAVYVSCEVKLGGNVAHKQLLITLSQWWSGVPTPF